MEPYLLFSVHQIIKYESCLTVPMMTFKMQRAMTRFLILEQLLLVIRVMKCMRLLVITVVYAGICYLATEFYLLGLEKKI